MFREDSAQYSRRSTVSSSHTESSNLNLEERIPDICITSIHEESGHELLHSEDGIHAHELNQTPLSTTIDDNEKGSLLGMSDLKLDDGPSVSEAKLDHVIEMSGAM